MSMFKSMFGGVINSVSRYYKSLLRSRLEAYGLKYNDLLIETPDVMKAVATTSPTVQLERTRRIKRAIDASAKKKTLPAGVVNENPFDLYLQKRLDVIKFEREEREIMNN